MSKTIIFLATHYGDYRLDYERFLADNITLLQKNGIAYPWLAPDASGIIWQRTILQKLKDLEAGDALAASQLKQALTGQDRALFAAPLGIVLTIMADILKYIKANVPDWENAATSFVWLACERAREIDGAARYNLPRDACETLYANSIKNAGKLLGDLEACLAMADTVKILPDLCHLHIPEKELVEALGLDSPGSAISPMRQTERESREAVFVKAILKRAFSDPDINPPFDLPGSDLTMLAPARLKEIYTRISRPMEDLATKYGANLHFPEPKDQPDWVPLKIPEPSTLRQAIKTWLGASSREEQDYFLRLLENTTSLKTLGDARSYALGLRGIYSLPAQSAPLLSVLTLTKNQAKYIGECIESVLAQKTDFPVRHIILDDCSADGTQEIITSYARKYPSIYPIFMDAYREAGENVKALFSACHSKYAALCDGDDYFIDPLKLQKQVDFLERHPDCSICFHPVEKRYEDGSPTELYPPESMLPGKGKRHIFTIRDLLAGNMIQTNSAVYRWRFPDGLPAWFDATLNPSDWYWHLLHAEIGMIGYLPEAMSVYRRHGASLFVTAEKGHVEHREKYGDDELKLYSVLDRHFRGKYRQDLQRLANGVFADYLKIYMNTGSDALLNRGVEKYPLFAKSFLSELKLVSGTPAKSRN